MKKILFGILLSLMTYSFANAGAIEKGSFVIQPDLNLGGYGLVGWGGFGFGATLNLEYAVHDYASVGGYVGYSTIARSGTNFHRIGFGARGVFHFWNLIDDKTSGNLRSDVVDFYFPLHLGYHIYKFDKSYYWAGSSGKFRMGAGLGVRYFFNEKIGINLEVGGMEMSWSKLGVTIKL